MTKSDVPNSEYNVFYTTYLNQVPEHLELIFGLQKSLRSSLSFYSGIDPDKLLYRYQPEKWSIKEVLQHIIDTERIFSYRMFRIGRGDETPLANMDQNIYNENSHADAKTFTQLIDEFSLVRQHSLSVANSFAPTDWRRMGTASNFTVSARALGFFILGHELWHQKILKERYLN